MLTWKKCKKSSVSLKKSFNNAKLPSRITILAEWYLIKYRVLKNRRNMSSKTDEDRQLAARPHHVRPSSSLKHRTVCLCLSSDFGNSFIFYNDSKGSLLSHCYEYISCHRSMRMTLYTIHNSQADDGLFQYMVLWSYGNFFYYNLFNTFGCLTIFVVGFDMALISYLYVWWDYNGNLTSVFCLDQMYFFENFRWSIRRFRCHF